ncbi:hypothetical protein MTO96_018383 [Rhipicephalus appendiculatus]
MKALRLWVALLAWSSAASLVVTTTTPCALPWTVSRESHPDLPDHVFHTLMRCPVGLHGCWDELVSCVPPTRARTCSCAPSCKIYGDCCWNVELNATLETKGAPRITCVKVSSDEKQRVYMVSSCTAAWPDDDVRAACERTQPLGDHFHLIPVTSNSSEVTYRTKRKPPTVLSTSERPPSGSVGGEAQQYVTLVCVSLSIFCLVLKLVVFGAYRESRSFASKCTLCLSVTLMITQVLYMITASLGVPTLACAIGAALVHYGFLSTFCWTCALSFDICRSLTNLTLSSNRESIPVTYSAFSCGLPLLIVASAVAVDLTLPGSALSPRYGRLACWIGSFWGLVVYFLVPLAILLLCCFAFYLRVVLYVSKTSIAQKAVGGIRDRQRAHAVLFVRLALVMGSPWAVAFLATAVESVVLDCVVNFLVGLQGVYLFVAFKDYRYFLSSIRKRVGETYSSDVSRSSHANERSSTKSTGA